MLDQQYEILASVSRDFHMAPDEAQMMKRDLNAGLVTPDLFQMIQVSVADRSPEEIDRARQSRLRQKRLDAQRKYSRRTKPRVIAPGRHEKVTREEIIARDKGVCHICLGRVETDDTHIDHIIPLTRGGSHTAENLAVAHSSCNLRKGDSLLSELQW